MVLNSSKPEAAYFSIRELTNPPKIGVDGIQIITKPQIKVLGMIFDYKMSWDIHVEKLLKEANSQMQAIWHIQLHLPKACMNVIKLFPSFFMENYTNLCTLCKF
jgi:hypothetical protein